MHVHGVGVGLWGAPLQDGIFYYAFHTHKYTHNPTHHPTHHKYTHTHRCDLNWFGDNCSQFICDVDTTLCGNGTCAINPKNQSQFLCACPTGYTGDRCQYVIPGGGKAYGIPLVATNTIGGCCFDITFIMVVYVY